MPRRTIDRDTLSLGNKTTLRRFQGVRNTPQLVTAARNAGVDLGANATTQQNRAFNWVKDRYNATVREEQAKTARDRQIRQNISRQNKRIRKHVSKEETTLSRVRELMSNNRGNKLSLKLIEVEGDGTNVIRNWSGTIPTNGFGNWWSKNQWTWREDSEEDVFGKYPGADLYSYKPDSGTGIVTNARIVQAFADGVTNCVLTPLLNWFEEKVDEAKSEPSKKRYAALINKTKKLMIEYPVSVPESDFQKIADVLQIKIKIEFPIPVASQAKPIIEVESSKKFLRSFNFINTRIDHVDLKYDNILSNDPIVVTSTEMNEIVDDDDGLLHYQKNNLGICEVHTREHKYVLENDYMDTVKEFESKWGLDMCKIDHIKNPKLSNFILQGVHYNGTVDYEQVHEDLFGEFNGDDILQNKDDISHIDMQKAYTQFLTSRHYMGFMNKVNHFRKTDKVQGLGMYVITDIDYSGVTENTRNHLETMSVYNDDQIYTSPDLAFLDKHKATYRVVAGAWSVNRLDFDFTDIVKESDPDDKVKDPMINKKYVFGKTKIPYYSKWTGACNHISTEKSIFLRGGSDWYRAIKQTGVECAFFESGSCGRDNDEIMVSWEKTEMRHLSQINAYITAYTRLNVLEQLCAMDSDSIVRVCVDGIYFRETGKPITIVPDGSFRYKDSKTFLNKQCFGYTLGDYNGIWEGSDLERDGKYKSEAHIGVGGGGKTDYNLKDSGLCNVLYIAPSYKLARKKNEEYTTSVLDTTVWAKITNDPETKRNYKRKYNVLIFDEVSMMTDKAKDGILKDFGDMCFVIFCGDIGYQLPPVNEDGLCEMTTKNIGKVVRYSVNYRCKCPKLQSILMGIRKSIDTGNGKLSEVFNKLTDREIPFTYEVDDMILSPTHQGKDDWTARYGSIAALTLETEKLKKRKSRSANDNYRLECFENELNSHRESELVVTDKWFVRTNNRDYSTGEIVIGPKPIGVQSDLQHAFTVHSIQGETAQNKLIIHRIGIRDLRMLYTALSRAQTLDQIYIV